MHAKLAAKHACQLAAPMSDSFFLHMDLRIKVRLPTIKHNKQGNAFSASRTLRPPGNSPASPSSLCPLPSLRALRKASGLCEELGHAKRS